MEIKKKTFELNDNEDMTYWGDWVSQLVKRPTLDFGSGHDFTVHEFKPHLGLCADSMEPAWDSLSPSLSAPPLLKKKRKQKQKTLKEKKRYDIPKLVGCS